MNIEEETPRQRAARLRREKIAQNAESRTAFIFDTIKVPESATPFLPHTQQIHNKPQDPPTNHQTVQAIPKISDKIEEPKIKERVIEEPAEKPKEKPKPRAPNNAPKVSNSQSDAQKEAQVVKERARKQSKNISSSKIPFFYQRILISILCGAIFVYMKYQFSVLYTFLVLDLILVGASLLFAEKKTGIMDNIAALKYLAILKDLLSQLLFTSKTLSVFLFVTVVTSLLIN